jgi:hypothetical protein
MFSFVIFCQFLLGVAISWARLFHSPTVQVLFAGQMLLTRAFGSMYITLTLHVLNGYDKIQFPSSSTCKAFADQIQCAD